MPGAKLVFDMPETELGPNAEVRLSSIRICVGRDDKVRRSIVILPLRCVTLRLVRYTLGYSGSRNASDYA